MTLPTVALLVVGSCVLLIVLDVLYMRQQRRRRDDVDLDAVWDREQAIERMAQQLTREGMEIQQRERRHHGT